MAVCSVEIFRPAEGNDAAPEENKPTFCPFFIYISVVSSAAQTFFAHSQVRKTFFFYQKNFALCTLLFFLGEDETFVQSSGCVCEGRPAGEMIHNPDSLQKIRPLQAANGITLVR